MRAARVILLAALTVLPGIANATDMSGTIPAGTFAAGNFETDLFSGSAIANIPIDVPAGAAGVAPKIVLRYNSVTVDELKPTDPGQSTGLGWSLDIGGFILRDPRGTATTNDDTFKLVFGGTTYDLIRVNVAQNIWHTKDEAWLKLQFFSTGGEGNLGYWMLTTKDGTTHRFGFNRNAKNIAWVTEGSYVPYRYSIDEVTTTSGVSVRYAYTQIHGSIPQTGQIYDRAQYIDTITYAYKSGAAVGPIRQVKFTWSDRFDFAPAPIQPIDELKRLDRIDVTVGTDPVRSYLLAYDYSIDRAPGHTYPGGATGDLTLRSVTVVGADGASTLPPFTFDYTGAQLSRVSNGLGGSVNFAYQRVQSRTVYDRCVRPVNDEYGFYLWCADWAPSLTTNVNPDQYFEAAYVRALEETETGWVPLYSACLRVGVDEYGQNTCLDFGPSLTPDGYGFSTAAGEVRPAAGPGLAPLYRACYRASFDEYGFVTGCSDYMSSMTMDQWGLSTLVGYAYAKKIDRYRVIDRTSLDGRGGSTGMDFQYTSLRATTTEFRGHAAVRAIDNLGSYTDTWFKQDDDFKGRPYQSENRTGPGSLLTRVTHTWSKTNPFPGVTFPFVSLTGTTTCDDNGAACRDTEQTFAFDTSGNPTSVRSRGDLTTTADDREEQTTWVINTTAWIHRPSRVALVDGAGAIVRERWLSYDGSWGTGPSLGLLTQEERRLAGGRTTAGNPLVTHTYDVYGNRTSTTDPRGCTTTTSYGTSQAYPASVSTCLSHTTTFDHDERWGKRSRLTDPNLQPTRYDYDTFGRLKKVTGPLDTASSYGSVSYDYADLGNPGSQRVVTFRTERHGFADYIWSEEYFDGLGRTWQTRSEGPDGQVIEVQIVFDDRGLVAQKSVPRFTGAPTLWNVFSYDARGRVKQVRNPDGTTVLTAYAPDRVTVTDPRGNIRRKFYDFYGRMVRAEEINGAETYVTRYEYDPTDALTRVTNHLGHVTQTFYDALGRKTRTQDPNMGQWIYEYDVAGNLTRQTDAKQQVLTFTYDLQSRVRTKAYPGGATITYTYDDTNVPLSRGRLTAVTDLATATTFRYDEIGRTVRTQRVLDGTTYTLDQQYDALSRVTSQTTLPDNETITFAYNEAGWLRQVSGYVDTIRYNARGQRTSMFYSNLTTSTFDYDETSLRLSRRWTTGPSGPLQPGGLIQSLRYSYDANGNIIQITDDVGTSGRTFTYDPLNRLASASGTFGAPAGGVPSQITQNYRFDAIGNLLEKGGQLYAYSDALHPSAVTTGPDGSTYTYDANGNMLNGAGRTNNWNADNRLAASTVQGGASVVYAYDHTGMRVSKVTAASATRYPFAGYEIDSVGTVTKYIRIGDEILAAGKSGGQRLFYHADHLGGVNYVTDAGGYRLQLVEYSPWGSVSRNDGNAEPGKRFTGKELDPETGLLYYGGRYYDAALSRFISPDPFVPSPGNPQSLNRYSYVLNNPVGFVDPSGFFWKELADFFKEVLKLKLEIGRIAVPVVAGIVVGVVVTMGTGGCVVCGAAAGGATAGALAGGLNTLYYGGSAAEVFQNGAIGAAIGGVAGAAGAAVGAAAGGGFGGALAGGAVGGSIQAGLNAAVYGGNIGESAAIGTLTGAVWAAAAFGGYALLEGWSANAEAGRHRSLTTSESISVENQDVPIERARWWWPRGWGRPVPPPDEPLPPGWNENYRYDWGTGRGSRGEPRYWDENGGEYRYHRPDQHHKQPHWDYRSNENWNSPWKHLYPAFPGLKWDL